MPRFGELATKTTAINAESAFIGPAEVELEGRLGGFFTVPFSTNNLTVRGLAAELAYLKAVLPDDSAKTEQIRDAVDKSIADLIAGRRQMITSSGETIGTAGNQPWSSTKEYHPVFNMRDPVDWGPDVDQLDDEEMERL